MTHDYTCGLHLNNAVLLLLTNWCIILSWIKNYCNKLLSPNVGKDKTVFKSHYKNITTIRHSH